MALVKAPRYGRNFHITTRSSVDGIFVTEGYFPDPGGRLRDGVRQYDRMTKKRRKTVA